MLAAVIRHKRLITASPFCASFRRQLCIFALFLLSLGFTLNALYPFMDASDDRAFAQVVLAEDGRVLRAFADTSGVWRHKVTLEQVPRNYLDTLLTYEDRWFYSHPGVNPIAMVRAAIQNARCACVQSGGSTLSMQVARIFHPHSRTLGGKLYQILRALQLELTYSKREILTLYLNFAPFGGTIEGVQAASFTYLEKDVSQLTDAEAALLTVLPQAPSYLRPDRHPERAERWRDKVLDRMAELEVWGAERIALAKLESVRPVYQSKPQHAPIASRRLALKTSEPTIQTTLDFELQTSLALYAGEKIQRLPAKTSMAILVAENATGHIKAYVGSADFNDASRFGHVDMVQGIRSPGSALKPFIYGLALDKGIAHSASLLQDVPKISGEYRPQNYHKGFSGAVSLSRALQTSLNLPAVQVLDKIGPGAFASYLKNVGVPLRFTGKPNLSLALGGVGVSLEELVTLYMGLASEGQVKPLRLTPGEPAPGQYLISPQSAWAVYKILKEAKREDRISGGMFYQRENALAWKTGTSYGGRDAWAIGFDAEHTYGVWVGRPDGTASPGHLGAQTALPLLFQIADEHAGTQSLLAQPEGVKKAQICWPLGHKEEDTPEALCHSTHTAWIVNDQVPPTESGGEVKSFTSNPVTLTLDANSGLRVTPYCASAQVIERKVALWPRALEPWLPERWRASHQIPALAPGCAQSAPLLLDELRIASVENGASYLLLDPDQPLALPLQALGGQGMISWFVNGRFVGDSEAGMHLLHYFSEQGEQELVAIDTLGNLARVEIRIGMR